MDVKTIFRKIKDSRPITISIGQLREAELQAKKEIFEEIVELFEKHPTYDVDGKTNTLHSAELTDKGVMQNTALIQSEIRELKNTILKINFWIKK